MRKIIAGIFIAAGLLIVLYPFFQTLYANYWHNKLMSQWEEMQQGEEWGYGEVTGEMPYPTEERENEREMPQAPGGFTLMGVLVIEKIDLEVPVLKGTEEEILKVGVGFLEESAPPGQGGNFVLTAHRSHTYGRFFNRLEEMDSGDKISFLTPQKSYDYRVFKSKIVKKEEITPFTLQGEKEIITLITCHPLYRPNPPYRLLLQGERL